MNFVLGFIVGCILMIILMSAVCAARHEKKFIVRRNRATAPFPSMQPPATPPASMYGSAECQCKGYQGLG